uniref:Uncharacterized protein n=1 Tax=Plectus sambesii TaxID=2011161 RepID=A0A914WGR1_9BILA
MKSPKLFLACVALTVACAQAKPQPPNGGPPPPPPNGGPPPPPPNGGPPPPPPGPPRKAPKSDESHEKSGEEVHCGQPDSSWLNTLNAYTQAQVAAVWKDYTIGNNCTDQLAAQRKILKDAFMAIMDEKAANLSAAAKAVYDQMKAGMAAFEALSPEDQAALEALRPPGGSAFGGKNGHNHSKSSEESSAAVESAEESAEEDDF